MSEQIHIWQASTKDAEKDAEALISTLSLDEKLRGERMINPVHSQRFLLAQAILRNVLAPYIDQAPEAIQFQRGEYGKPYLLNTDVEFNLTHSHQCVVVAVTRKVGLGVDVEYLECDRRFDDLVKRFFSKKEQQEYFEYSSDDARRLAFYRGWTRKEAYLKAIGVGLSYPLDRFTVSLAANQKRALLCVEDDTSVRSKWTVLSFHLDEKYLVSLAVAALVDEMQTYRWAFSSTA